MELELFSKGTKALTDHYCVLFFFLELLLELGLLLQLFLKFLAGFLELIFLGFSDDECLITNHHLLLHLLKAFNHLFLLFLCFLFSKILISKLLNKTLLLSLGKISVFLNVSTILLRLLFELVFLFLKTTLEFLHLLLVDDFSIFATCLVSSGHDAVLVHGLFGFET